MGSSSNVKAPLNGTFGLFTSSLPFSMGLQRNGQCDIAFVEFSFYCGFRYGKNKAL